MLLLCCCCKQTCCCKLWVAVLKGVQIAIMRVLAGVLKLIQVGHATHCNSECLGWGVVQEAETDSGSILLGCLSVNSIRSQTANDEEWSELSQDFTKWMQANMGGMAGSSIDVMKKPVAQDPVADPPPLDDKPKEKTIYQKVKASINKLNQYSTKLSKLKGTIRKSSMSQGVVQEITDGLKQTELLRKQGMKLTEGDMDEQAASKWLQSVVKCFESLKEVDKASKAFVKK